jgi:hypothetical protein
MRDGVEVRAGVDEHSPSVSAVFSPSLGRDEEGVARERLDVACDVVNHTDEWVLGLLRRFPVGHVPAGNV